MNKKILFSVLAGLLLLSSCSKETVINSPIVVNGQNSDEKGNNPYSSSPVNTIPVEKDGCQYGYQMPFVMRPYNEEYHHGYEIPVWTEYENSNMEVSYKTFGVQFIDHRVVIRTDIPLYRLKVGVIMDYYITRFGMKCREYFVDVYLREVPVYNQPYCKYTFDIRDVYDALTYDYHGNPSIRVHDIEYTYKDDTVREVTYGWYSTYGTKEFIELPRNILEAYR